ncbi:hypothetical protein NL676_019498 [Syzygium grande]|nr:hypothetical protein NL676_019498 [Syzygium grande]
MVLLLFVSAPQYDEKRCDVARDSYCRSFITYTFECTGWSRSSICYLSCHTTAYSESLKESWGWVDFGRLGHGNSSDVFMPQPIKTLRGLRIKQIARGDSHCLAVTMEGGIQRRSVPFIFGLCTSLAPNAIHLLHDVVLGLKPKASMLASAIRHMQDHKPFKASYYCAPAQIKMVANWLPCAEVDSSRLLIK